VTLTLRRGLVAIAVLVMLMLGAARGLTAQGRNWDEPYEAGVTAIKKGQWVDAIAQFTKAIAIDSKSQANKHIEGLYYDDYFPFYYRGIAYLQTGDLRRADADFQVALKTKMPDGLAQDLARRNAQLQTTLAQNTPPPVQPTDPGRGGAGTGSAAGNPTGSTAGNTSGSTAGTTSGNTAGNTTGSTTGSTAGGGAGGAGGTTAGRSQPPGNANETKPPTGPDPAVQAAGIVKEGNAYLAQGRLADAQDSFQRALKIAPQAAGAADGLTAITTRRTKSTTALAAGRDLASKHQFAAAGAKYQEAVDADGSNAQAVEALHKTQTYSTSVNDGRTMMTQSNWSGARVQFTDAQSLDPDRFKAEGLDTMLTEIGKHLASPPPSAPTTSTAAPTAPTVTVRPPLHDALVAYLDGIMPRAIELLQPMASNDATYDAQGRASIHAYLGAAYATNALTSRADADRASWHQKAVKEFQIAEAAEPGFQLSERVVSPAIKAFIDEARRK
jgi:tetratricopeptide (TPR) repeat protein